MRVFNRSACLGLPQVVATLGSMLAAASLRAEVIVDGSLGGGERALSGPAFEIRHTDGASAGRNLFHSLKRLNLNASESATFTGPNNFDNILARVTGGASSINGQLASEIAGANLFLINPAGIIFGSNASINVSGSFFATTADSIKLGTDGRFSATDPAGSMLTVSEPSAFGFLTSNPAAIRVNGSNLSAPAGKTLGLIGGDVLVSGRANLEAGDVQIVSVRSPGEATLRLATVPSGLRWASINGETFTQHGDVSVDGTGANPQAPQSASIRGQRVVIRGGTFVVKNAAVDVTATEPGDGVFVRTTGALTVTDSALIQSTNLGDFRDRATVDILAGSAAVSAGSQINTLTFQPGSGGNLRLTIAGAVRIEDGSGIVTESDSLERGGDVFISAQSVAINASTVLSQADGLTKTGNIFLDVAGALDLADGSVVGMGLQQAANERIVATADRISLSGASGFTFSDFSPEGTGGSVILTARDEFSIVSGGFVEASTAGRDGATVEITAGRMLISGRERPDLTTGIIAENASTNASRGGEIRLVIAGALDVLDGGVISTNTLGAGSGGNIFVQATDLTVTGLDHRRAENTLQAGLSAQNLGEDDQVPSGDSGSIRLSLSGQLEVRAGGEIVVDTSGPGRGGDIEISARDVTIASAGMVAARTFNPIGGGRGGNVSIDVSDAFEIGERGEVTVGTFGTGAGGTISVRSDALLVSGRGAHISAVSGSPTISATGSGGGLFLDVNDLRIASDGLVTASTYGPGSGGSIAIEAGTISITDDSRIFASGISAETLSPGAGGPGGAVRIVTETLKMRGQGAVISTESMGGGNSGRIRLTAGTVSLREGSSIQSSSVGTGRAGSVEVEARQSVVLLDGGSLSVAAPLSDAGDIRVRAGARLLLDGASIAAQAGRNGGNIDLRARDVISLIDSEITAAAGLNGGNIFIDPVFVLLDRSVISANAIFGRGGNIRIISDFFFASPDSLVTATSELGIDGTVQIDALNTDLKGNLIELPSALIDADALLRDLCTMKIENFSSFVSEGRGGLPPLPGEALPSLMIVP